MGTSNKDTVAGTTKSSKKTVKKTATKPVAKAAVAKAPKALKAPKAAKPAKAAVKPVVKAAAKPAAKPAKPVSSNKQDLLDLKAALKAELQAEKAAEAAAYQQILASAGKVDLDKAPPISAPTNSVTAPAVPTPPAVPTTQPVQKAPILRNGVGEMITSSSKPKLEGVHKLRDVIVGFGVLLIIAVGIWSAIQYRNYRHLHSPAYQAELFKNVNDHVDQLQNYMRYGDQIASLQNYLDSKPDQQYRDKATFRLANALLNSHRNDEAITEYKKVEPIQEFQMNARRGLAKAYLDKGDNSSAHYYQQQVIDSLKSAQKPDGLQLVIDQAQLEATNK